MLAKTALRGPTVTLIALLSANFAPRASAGRTAEPILRIKGLFALFVQLASFLTPLVLKTLNAPLAILANTRVSLVPSPARTAQRVPTLTAAARLFASSVIKVIRLE